MQRILTFTFLLFALFLSSCDQSGRGIEGDLSEDIIDEPLPEGCYETFCININEYTSTISVQIEVKEYSALTARLTFETTGLSTQQDNPLLVFVNEIQTSEIMVFNKTGDAWSLRYNILYNDGAVNAEHSSTTTYQLPFAVGTTQSVSQGYDGTFSHEGENAIDIPLEEGTAIYAMRSGKVVKTEERYNSGGVDEKYYDTANYIHILHDDLTIAKYVHLQQNGVAVSVGQSIRVGELIGYSGNTGYSSGPHLHFSISALDDDLNSISFRTLFKTASSIAGEELEEMKSYTAVQL